MIPIKNKTAASRQWNTPQDACLPKPASYDDGDSGSIGAVIVSHNPPVEFGRNVRAVAAQVRHVVVVDNASSSICLPSLQVAEAVSNVRVLYNRCNVGVATALNQGVCALRRHGVHWILTLDQDSLVPPRFVAAFSNGIQLLISHGTRPCIVTPSLREAAFSPLSEASVKDSISIECIDNAITSGTLYRADLFDVVGYFRDDFFIDMVDHEFHLRLMTHGYSIYRFNHIPLLHNMGLARKYSIAGFTFISHNWSPIRRYFSTRNRMIVYKQYGGTYPLWCAKDMYILLKNIATVLFFESDKLSKIGGILLGLRHGLVGKARKHPTGYRFLSSNADRFTFLTKRP